VNTFLWAAVALVAGLSLPAAVCLRKGPPSRLAALDLAASLGTLALLLIAEGTGRGVYFDVALVSAILAFASGMVFARFLERWV
jgi:multicomponent Na+:H+ antiporter subunit F